jgi:hypothetical protein
MDVVVRFGLLAVVAHAQSGNTQPPSLASTSQTRASAPIDPGASTAFSSGIFVAVWHTCSKHQTRRKRAWQAKRLSASAQNTLRSGVQNQKGAKTTANLLILVFASHVKVRSNQVLSFALSWASLNSSSLQFRSHRGQTEN